MSVDPRKRVTVMMRNKHTGEIEFNLTIYGWTRDEFVILGDKLRKWLEDNYPAHSVANVIGDKTLGHGLFHKGYLACHTTAVHNSVVSNQKGHPHVR